TLDFQNVPAKKVLKELTEQFDLDYKIDGNIIRIRPWAEQFFSLNFLDTNVEMGFDVGGDVLGSGGTKAASGLSGSVTMTGKGAQKANPYIILEEMIKKVKSEKGILSINKLSGSLYIKDKPSIVKTVAKLLNHFKEMLSRQILIEARIIEVTLSKGFEYGIDWDLIKASSSASSIKLSKVAWDLTNGLVFNGYNGSFTFNSVISALETFGKVKIVSNPTIRVKHGCPAVISVGNSITYKKSVETTIEKTDLGQTEKTQVEVSTVFDGLILGVIPFIEPSGKINLLINPVKSDVDTESISHPESVGGGVTISLPKVGIKEISTTISVNDGDIVILGGLISSEDVKRDKGVPLLSKIPVLGYLFQNDYVSKERKELVIVLNVRII
ncbi:MAG: pilus (MSHA type) biogenesis protein MshL, partial [Deltaproteobacteria bacterium]|nr:pilus (MSHA type) biogenesis protein MshL [Deltaproteobacteria bacterium]